MKKTKPEKIVSPGEILNNEYLVPRKMTQYRLAHEIGVPAQRIAQIIRGERGITAETDLRLCRFLGLPKGYWLRTQAAYEVKVTEPILREELDMIVPWKPTIKYLTHPRKKAGKKKK